MDSLELRYARYDYQWGERMNIITYRFKTVTRQSIDIVNAVRKGYLPPADGYLAKTMPVSVILECARQGEYDDPVFAETIERKSDEG